MCQQDPEDEDQFSWTCGKDARLAHCEPVGSGGFAEVYKLKNTETGETFARKIVRMTIDVSRADIEREAAVIDFIKSRNGHKNIIEALRHGWLKGAFRVYYIDMELAQTTLTAYIAAVRTQTTPFEFLNPNLAPVFLNSTCTTEERIHNVWVIGKHIIDGLVFLHAGSHVHRDLKPSNVLYCLSSNLWKLTDFGISAKATERRPRPTEASRGTSGYRPPELLHSTNASFTNKTDIWQFGCVLYELATLRPAFKEDYLVPQLTTSNTSVQIPQISPTTSIQRRFSSLVADLFQISPSDRPSALEVSKRLASYIELKSSEIQSTSMSESLPPLPFMVPYERNPFFVGSQHILEAISHQLRDGHPSLPQGRIALFGMGGIGKTQAALEFVYRYRDNYSQIYWVSAVTQASLLDGYERIGKRVGIPTPAKRSPMAIAEQVLSWLTGRKDWLLVVDNLDDFDILSTGNMDMLSSGNMFQILLPLGGPRQHTLITSRNPHVDGIPAQGVEMTLLDEKAAIELLCSLSRVTASPGSKEWSDAQRVVEELGHLPLAISHAGAYIKQISGTFADYINHYVEYRSSVNSWIPKGPRPYPYSVATTGLMSFHEIANKNPCAANLFRLLAFFNPDGVLIEFLKSGVKGMDDDLERLVSDEVALSEALLRFETRSLIKWDRQNSSIILHRLVQAVVKDEMSDADSITFKAMTIDVSDRSFPQEWNNKTRAICRRYVGQLIGPLMDPETSETEKSARVMRRVGWFLRDDGKMIDSERLLIRSFHIYRRILGGEHPDTLRSMNNLALTYLDQGRTAEAAALQEEVVEKRKLILGADHPDTLTSMNNLALTYRDQGRTAEAAALQEEVVDKHKLILGADHPDTLTLMNNLALTYRDQGRTAEAAALQEEVVAKRRWILGAEHPHTLRSMDNLALMYLAQGRMWEAAALQEEVLEKQQQILGPEHPATLTSMNNLASTYRAQGRTWDAVGLQEDVLEKRRRILGAEHPDTLRSMDNLALTYLDQSKMGEAAALQEEVLEKQRRILGAEHPDTLRSMDNLALMYLAQGRMEEAGTLQEEVLEKQRRILGAEHPDTLRLMGNLASTYRAQGRMEEAAVLQEQVLEKRKRILGAEHPATLTSMSNLAVMYQDQGRTAEAAALQEEVLEKQRQILGAEHPATLRSRNNLANLALWRSVGQIISGNLAEQPPVEMT